MTIRTSSETIEDLGSYIAKTPRVKQALLDGEVLAIYYDREKGFYRLKKQKHIPTKKKETTDSE